MESKSHPKNTKKMGSCQTSVFLPPEKGFFCGVYLVAFPHLPREPSELTASNIRNANARRQFFDLARST